MLSRAQLWLIIRRDMLWRLVDRKKDEVREERERKREEDRGKREERKM